MFDFSEIVRISLGTGHSLITKQDGSVWASGGNNFGEFGSDSPKNHIINFEEVFSDVANVIAAGGAHSMVLKQDGSVWFTGRNHYGQLGIGTNVDQRNYIRVISGAAKAIAAGPKHSMVVREDDSVWNAGCNVYGQLADGSEVDRYSFVRGLFLVDDANPVWTVFEPGVKAVAAGADHSLVLGRDGTVWVSGANLFGQLGIAAISTSKPKDSSSSIDDGSRASTKIFELVPFANAKAITAGGYHSLVLKQDGSVWATGANDYGQLGDATMKTQRTFKQVYTKRMQRFDAQVMTAGFYHSVVLEKDGTVWATGANDFGQLGDGTTIVKTQFTHVMSEGQAVAAGGWHSMVLKYDGRFWATGRNSYGQLGDGSTHDRKKFVKLMEISDHGAYLCAVVTMICSIGVIVASLFLVSSHVFSNM